MSAADSFSQLAALPQELSFHDLQSPGHRNEAPRMRTPLAAGAAATPARTTADLRAEGSARTPASARRSGDRSRGHTGSSRRRHHRGDAGEASGSESESTLDVDDLIARTRAGRHRHRGVSGSGSDAESEDGAAVRTTGSAGHRTDRGRSHRRRSPSASGSASDDEGSDDDRADRRRSEPQRSTSADRRRRRRRRDRDRDLTATLLADRASRLRLDDLGSSGLDLGRSRLGRHSDVGLSRSRYDPLLYAPAPAPVPAPVPYAAPASYIGSPYAYAPYPPPAVPPYVSPVPMPYAVPPPPAAAAAPYTSAYGPALGRASYRRAAEYAVSRGRGRLIGAR